MHPIIRLLRPHQYAKNLLLFAAPGAAGRLDEGDVAAAALLAYVLFCAVSSAGYVANDLLDAEADRSHPTKQYRPIASGAVSTQTAQFLLFGLGVTAVATSFLLGAPFTLVLVAYGATSILYSTFLKRVPWLELLVVSTGFVLRAVAGGAATDTPISAWFLVVVSAGALLVITGKRVGELLSLGAATPSRKVLAAYPLEYLRFVSAAAATCALGGYAAWAASEVRDQMPGATNSFLLRLTAVPFALALLRYLMLSSQGAGEAPEFLIVRDRLMLAALSAWVVIYTAGLYL